ncbi:hypothetical protein BAUCODRAFT_389536 [Baudoinia panamericana UAMH 10762]|uniref:Peroxin 26 n=1 Tax=Baudoinia panamericana (strain UAMH 10762) TaxID=717646 RepID=M2NI75_BAUPA|nr:uncharacterized protein BAUCODRAFT_389536 [Baudoinia panamericana UAMH 10762]EMC99059.1 hypothetical protein BAUCODRAFT_389536 [Baudoinia panamericana UAMH 10762]
MAAATETLTYQDALDSQYLSSSLSSLSRSRSTNSLIVRTYKEATQLYLTKRFKEALETLELIISIPSLSHRSGDGNGEAQQNGQAAAPVAQSSKGTRTKVWVFYLSLLHAIIELGPEEGKLTFGSTRWRELANKAREGSVWEEIVQAGYGGVEGEVDADVVLNLATLLLGHMATQKLNQQRLESWLATCDAVGPGSHVSFADGTKSPVPNGASSTPKGLATRLKLLELYALHVLPANGEWSYAKEFIEMSDSLDDERREAFLTALQSLREEKDGTAQRERDLSEQREREMEEQRQEEDARKAEEARQQEEKRKAQESERTKATLTDNEKSKANSATSSTTAKPTANGQHTKSASRAAAKAPRKAPSPPPGLYRRASSALNSLQQMVLQASRSMTGSSFALFRTLMFMAAFIILISRRDLRLRVQRALEQGWVKVKKTAGMAVKVSYI